MSIRKLRLRKGWTQQQLADIIGVNRSSISRYESGIRENKSMMAQIYHVLNKKYTIKRQEVKEKFSMTVKHSDVNLEIKIVAEGRESIKKTYEIYTKILNIA